MTDPRVLIVGAGYDRIAERFLDWAQRIEGDPRLDWLDDLTRRLPEGACLLELGCGAGEPCTRILSEQFSVTGIDISEEQLKLARSNAPGAELLCTDFLVVELPAESFDAVCSFYVFNHVPRELLAGLVERTAGWLRPDGLFMHAFGVADNPGWQGDWLGAETFFASFEAPRNRAIVEQAGLAVLRDEVVTFVEPDHGEASFQWILARR
jgi:cyclopropane fatty-acyl-phospholipid synthase-like methyltransferase